jgi:excisionase family DNA binding protein
MQNVENSGKVRKNRPAPLRQLIRSLHEAVESIREEIESLQGASDSDRLLTRQEAADRLRVSTRTLDTMEASGEIQAVRIRGRVLYHPDTIDAFIRRAARGGDSR